MLSRQCRVTGCVAMHTVRLRLLEYINSSALHELLDGVATALTLRHQALGCNLCGRLQQSGVLQSSCKIWPIMFLAVMHTRLRHALHARTVTGTWLTGCSQ
jgi:hypothetical protein